MKRDMRKYILRKLVELIFTLLFVTLLSFLLMRLSSVDPATAYAKRMIGNPTAEQIEKIRIQLGFDKPLLVQYGRWVWDLLHFDLGVSLANGHDVWTDAGVDPKTVQYLAGHENSKTTMDIYAKVKYNKPEELFGVVNGAFHQAIAE